jgi:hypothetical protein
VKIVMDRQTGRSKGYGFIVFKSPQAANLAVATPYPVIDGKQANCNLASLGAKNPIIKGRGTKRHYETSSGGGVGGSGNSNVSTNAASWSPPTKKFKIEGTSAASSTPRLSYVKMLEKEKGIVITKEMVKERVEELRRTDIFEAWKYYLEMYELFRGDDAEGREYYNNLLTEVRQARKRQLEQEGPPAADFSVYYTTTATATTSIAVEQEQQQVTSSDQHINSPQIASANEGATDVAATIATASSTAASSNETGEETRPYDEADATAYDLSQNSESFAGSAEYTRSHYSAQDDVGGGSDSSHHQPPQQYTTDTAALSELDTNTSHIPFSFSEPNEQEQVSQEQERQLHEQGQEQEREQGQGQEQEQQQYPSLVTPSDSSDSLNIGQP